MAKAVLAFSDKQVLPDGAIIDIQIWHVPTPVPGSPHQLKYRLFYGYAGERLVGYDNERGKGDHRHFKGEESAYTFTNAERLIEDFLSDIQKLRGQT